MSNRLHIQGEYPADWNAIGDRVREEAGHRCIRCGHPYKTGAHGKGEWTRCDEQCTHTGPLGIEFTPALGETRDEAIEPIADETRTARAMIAISGNPVCARWRILTVHHLDGDKSNCEWWNLLALCQRCHLQIQTRLNPSTPYFLEHSAWFRPYAAGFYAKKYEGRDITREEALARMEELLSYERLA